MSSRFLFAVLAVFLLFPAHVFAERIYIDPDQETFGVGDTVIATVRIDTNDECINAASVEMTYPKDSMRLVDFGRGQSILSLWIETPEVQGNSGRVTFSGGIPGGYCGRIPGDPALSNILGKVVFTVMSADAKNAVLSVGSSSRVYRSDGLGTEVPVAESVATYTLIPQPTQTENPWLKEVGDDTIPPEPFIVEVGSERGFFGGTYYLVFSTVDKQSGIDYYEYFERGGWKIVTSPYQVRNLLLLKDLQLRAVDKAGNVRLGTFDEENIPSYEFGFIDYAVLIIAILILLGLGYGTFTYIRRSESPSQDTSPMQ